MFHITIGVVLVEYLYDELLIISVHITLGTASEKLTTVNRNLFILFKSRLFGIKGSRPNKVDMLDQFLEGSGLVERQLYHLGNTFIVPALHLRIVLIELLPHLLPEFRIHACKRTHIGEFICKPEHLYAFIRTAL